MRNLASGTANTCTLHGIARRAETEERCPQRSYNLGFTGKAPPTGYFKISILPRPRTGPTPSIEPQHQQPFYTSLSLIAATDTPVASHPAPRVLHG